MNKLKWTVEFEVAPIWIADGFKMTDERAQQMIEWLLNYAEPDELGAKVVKSPTSKAILKAENADYP